MDNKRVTLVLVDTCAYRDANSDFPGIFKQLLPAFFSASKEKGILLLTHPILENEIFKHIEDSGLYKNYNSLGNNLRKCGETLKYLGCFDEDLFSRIGNIDIRSKLFDSFKQHYQDAIILGYGDPATVFSQYFKGEAPFAETGDKNPSFQMLLLSTLPRNIFQNIQMISYWLYQKTEIGSLLSRKWIMWLNVTLLRMHSQ